MEEPKLQEIHWLQAKLSEKGYHMLLQWKQEQGCTATYQALCDALKHKLVAQNQLGIVQRKEAII